MLNIKDWLKAKHKAQFEFLDVETGSGNSAKRKASRIIDGKVFCVSDLVKDKNQCMWLLAKFNDDLIHCKITRVYFKDGRAKYVTEEIEINEIERLELHKP